MSDVGNRGAVDADHLALMPRAQVVDRLRHHFLAGSGLADQQHRGGGRRHLLDLLEHVRDRRAFRHDRTRRPQHPHLAAQLRVLHRRVILELAVRFERLLQRAVAGPARQRLAGDAGNQPETLDHGGRNRAVLRRRAEVERTQHRFAGVAIVSGTITPDRNPWLAERFAIRLGEVVQRREATGLAEFQLRGHERDRRNRERGAQCERSALLKRWPGRRRPAASATSPRCRGAARRRFAAGRRRWRRRRLPNRWSRAGWRRRRPAAGSRDACSLPPPGGPRDRLSP